MALRALFFHQNLYSETFLLPKLHTFLFQYVKPGIFFRKIAHFHRLKNRIFQFCLFPTPTSSTINLPILASWHVLYQKMYLLFMGRKMETLDFVDLFFLGAKLAFKVSQPTKLELKNSTKSKFPVF